MRAARILAGRGVCGVPRSALQGRLLSPTPSRRGLASPSLSAATQRFLDDAGCTVPVIKGPMYPGSNPELVAAVSAAGGLGVVQPISLTHLYGHDFREGLQLIKRLTDKPFGVNFTILENKKYKQQMDDWMHVAAEEGVRFFLTSLGKPDRIVAFAKPKGIQIYHDVHTPKVAEKVAASGVDGLICLNDAMGGQTGNRSAETFAEELRGIDLPLIQAGAVADGADLRRAIGLGYAGASVGTRFLATHEAQVTQSYKDAIVAATGDDIVWTNKLAGTNSSVIKTDQVAAGGLRVHAVVAWLLRNRYTKTLTRTLMLKKAMETYKRAAFDDQVEIWQAGKGVDRIESIESCADVLEGFRKGLM
jgi:nitronate monooxygenase